jgi:chromosome segregation ATPase
MSDTDITALVERLREWNRWAHIATLTEAADALEALQARIKTHENILSLALDRAEKAEALEKAFEPRERALEARAEKAEAERDGIRLDLNDCNSERVKAETERDAALFDKAVAGGKVRVAEARAEKARNAALEKAAQVADPYGWCGYGKEICGPKIAAAIRALAGDMRSGSHACEYCGGTGIAHDQEGDRP